MNMSDKKPVRKRGPSSARQASSLATAAGPKAGSLSKIQMQQIQMLDFGAKGTFGKPNEAVSSQFPSKPQAKIPKTKKATLPPKMRRSFQKQDSVDQPEIIRQPVPSYDTCDLPSAAASFEKSANLSCVEIGFVDQRKLPDRQDYQQQDGSDLTSMLARLANLERFQVRCEGQLSSVSLAIDDHTARVESTVKVISDENKRTLEQLQQFQIQTQEDLGHLRRASSTDLKRIMDQARQDFQDLAGSLEATRSELQLQISRMQKLLSSTSRKASDVGGVSLEMDRLKAQVGDILERITKMEKAPVKLKVTKDSLKKFEPPSASQYRSGRKKSSLRHSTDLALEKKASTKKARGTSKRSLVAESRDTGTSKRRRAAEEVKESPGRPILNLVSQYGGRRQSALHHSDDEGSHARKRTVTIDTNQNEDQYPKSQRSRASELSIDDEQRVLIESAKDKLRMATIERKRMSSINGDNKRNNRYRSGHRGKQAETIQACRAIPKEYGGESLDVRSTTIKPTRECDGYSDEIEDSELRNFIRQEEEEQKVIAARTSIQPYKHYQLNRNFGGGRAEAKAEDGDFVLVGEIVEPTGGFKEIKMPELGTLQKRDPEAEKAAALSRQRSLSKFKQVA